MSARQERSLDRPTQPVSRGKAPAVRRRETRTGSGAHACSAPRVPVERSVQGGHGGKPRIVALRERLPAWERLARGAREDVPEELCIRLLRGHPRKQGREPELAAGDADGGGALTPRSPAEDEVGKDGGALRARNDARGHADQSVEVDPARRS